MIEVADGTALTHFSRLGAWDDGSMTLLAHSSKHLFAAFAVIPLSSMVEVHSTAVLVTQVVWLATSPEAEKRKTTKHC